MSTETTGYYGASRLFAEQYMSNRTTINEQNNLQASYKLLHGCGWVSNASTVENKLNRSIVHASMGYLSKNSRQMHSDFCSPHVEIYHYPQNLNYDDLNLSGTGDLISLAQSKIDPANALKIHRRKVEELLKPLVYRMLSKAYRYVLHARNVG